MLTGTIVNAGAIVAGGLIGFAVSKTGKAVSKDNAVVDGVMKMLGLAVIVLGLKMALVEHEFLPVVVCLCAGTFIGEIIRIESFIERFGTFLKTSAGSSSDTFVTGFMNASILFCVGAAAIVGALNDGLSGDASLLYVKSLLDGVTSIIFASTLGVGVIFSAIPIIIYQGAISLGAAHLSFLTADPVYINGISAAGGIIVMGIGTNIAGLTRLRVGNTLPALFLTPLADYIIGAIK